LWLEGGPEKCGLLPVRAIVGPEARHVNLNRISGELSAACTESAIICTFEW
jgi:hypothetical protein